jgi:hypothetical protein
METVFGPMAAVRPIRRRYWLRVRGSEIIEGKLAITVVAKVIHGR